MKDLTDYFTTSTKNSDVNAPVEKNTLLGIGAKETEDSCNEKVTIQVEVLNNIENSEKSKTKHERNKKKKKKRKQSDPVVTNISEIFSNNLNIISPTASLTTVGEVIELTKVDKKTSKENKKEKISDTQSKALNENVSKVNYKNESVVIKSQRNVEPVPEKNDDSQTSSSKPNAFQLMMEYRNKVIGQNSPGKELLEDDNINEDKDYRKLSARKNLLQNWAEKKGASKRKREEEDRDEIINHKLKKRAKRMKKLLKVDKDKVDEDSADIIIKRKTVKALASSSESSKDSVEVVEYSMTVNSPIVSILEENAQDKALNSSKSKENEQGLLSFIGVLNKSNNSNENNKNEHSEEINLIKVKMFEVNKKNAKSRLSLKKRKSESEFVTDKTKSKQSNINEKSKLSKRKIKQASSIEKSQTIVEKKTVDKNVTPRSLGTWKMRIKLGIEDSETKKDDKSDTKNMRTKRNPSFSYVESVTDESSTEGTCKIKQLQRKSTSKSKAAIILSDSDDDFIKSKTRKRPPTKPLKLEEMVLSDSEDDTKQKTVNKKDVKVAPVFLKATPKPKLDPDVLEARKQFLMSGIPSSLKKNMERQQSIEEKEYEMFPSISHIQQKCENPLWHLTEPELHLNTYLPLKIDEPHSCHGITTSHMSTKLDILREVNKVDKLKTLLNQIKADNPNYPVYKSFRIIYEKSGKMPGQKKPKHKPKNKNADDSVEIIEPDTPENDPIKNAMWTEKYKPKCSDDIIGNAESIKTMKKWLVTWLKFSEEINARRKRQRQDSNSESEFDTTDCDSRDSTKLPGNTLVLGGPCGSGKSTAIYAICKELGYNVIELNASSKRTGKRLIQELQEATQSHQVHKREKSMQNFLQTKTHKKKVEPKEHHEKKMCVLLIEDIDLVFEQDDGFITALIQLVATSKRPIVMTTTDPDSVFAQRFVSQYEYVSFLRLSSRMLATWLQIVCLVEGIFVNRDDIGCLLEFNKGDVRKTLLELQFWTQSGGQLIRDDIPVKIEKHDSIEEKVIDDEMPLAFIKDHQEGKNCTFVHGNCIGSFEIFRDHKPYSIPYHLNLGLLWWNIPNILNIPSYSSFRLKKFTENTPNVDMNTRKTHISDKTTLHLAAKLFDSLALTDVMFRKVSYFNGTEPNVKNYSSNVKDSLELGECMDGFSGYTDFVHNVTHTLVNGSIEEYKVATGAKSALNMALPNREERRWRTKHEMCEDVLQEPLSLSSYIERKSIALDYMPALRNIARSENSRAANNTKRKNRFRNYLRNLNINYNNGTLKLACNILQMNDEL